MDLIYKIYSVLLNKYRLKHDYYFFYNGDNKAPYDMFGSSDICANKKIYNMSHELQQGFITNDFFLSKSEELMLKAAKNSNVLMIKLKDFIELVPTDNSNHDYRVYDIYWNETKSGINPHEYNFLGMWNIGDSSYSIYRINEYKEERQKALAYWRDKQIDSILYD
jgi:hypothetical protein